MDRINNGQDLVRRQDLVDALARSTTETWAKDVTGIRAWWPHAVQIKDNILREIGKLEAVAPQAPCRIGDVLWTIAGIDAPYVVEAEVNTIWLSKTGSVVGLSAEGFYKEIRGDEIGKIAFFSFEEAEAALQDCKNVVDDVLTQAAVRCEQLNTDYANSAEKAGKWPLWDEYDNCSSGLLEGY